MGVPPRHPGISREFLDTLVGYHLRRAQISVFADFARAVRGLDITPGQFGVLALIAANHGLSQSALGKALGLDRSTMVGVIDRLERRGLVVRAAARGDRRSYALELSAAGDMLRRRVADRVRRHERRIARWLSANERRSLIDLLSRIGD
ncbi:MAG: MarR family transcriptional regulator [Alphaproteobacteria bacterium]|nr:MarR family transcriptional regulator [Alphaproteobacteria bacterium]